MSGADLELVVEIRLIVYRVTAIPNPLPEPLTGPFKRVIDRFVGVDFYNVLQEIAIIDEAIPRLEALVDL
ncbi:hypothetical protein C494_17123 [Natronorubrum bangense JCM 10635]|uniref:Uncharacterized protein n=1 Tax=Natronorubrum bangense JCM 10635 TaxID=1227500 RepID=L9W482_9EURY|nr:hypothetical protein [Natronorubrum bangense]ELY44137.1 hypothetical protein C494_17123 [Natronorubrum bangense JCM 10635]